MTLTISGACCLTMLVTTVTLLLLIRNVVGLNRNAILVNIFVSGVFLVSYTPGLIYIVWRVATHFGNGAAQNALLMFALNAYFCNRFCNPVIYYYTSGSFKQHTRDCFFSAYESVKRSWNRGQDREEDILVEGQDNFAQESPEQEGEEETGTMTSSEE